MYGDFRTLTKKVKTVSTSVEGMLKAVMKRLINEDESGNLKKVNMDRWLDDFRSYVLFNSISVISG